MNYFDYHSAQSMTIFEFRNIQGLLWLLVIHLRIKMTIILKIKGKDIKKNIMFELCDSNKRIEPNDLNRAIDRV